MDFRILFYVLFSYSLVRIEYELTNDRTILQNDSKNFNGLIRVNVFCLTFSVPFRLIRFQKKYEILQNNTKHVL